MYSAFNHNREIYTGQFENGTQRFVRVSFSSVTIQIAQWVQAY